MKVLPLMTHALPMVSPTCDKHWIMLEKSHRYAARLATNSFTQSYSDLLLTLHWKPIARLCVERQLLLVHKWINGQRFIPDFVLDEREERRQLRRRNQHNMQIHDMQISINTSHLGIARGIRLRVQTTRTPLHYAVAIWNLLPPGVPERPFSSFKREIRRFDTFHRLERVGENQYNGFTVPPLAHHYDTL